MFCQTTKRIVYVDTLLCYTKDLSTQRSPQCISKKILNRKNRLLFVARNGIEI